MHLFITLLTQCYYYELLSPSFFSFLSFQISATTLTNASPITTIVSLFIVFPPFSLGFHSGNCHKEVSIGFVFTILIVIRIRCFVNAFFYFFQKNSIRDICMESHVIALPGCYLISTRDLDNKSTAILSLCQCPLGLLPHFYLYKALSKDGSSIESVNALSGCYLISTALQEISTAIQETCVNALSGCYLISTESMRMYKRKVPSVCQCPLGLLPHFY